jgi:hypothetical protein
MTQAEMEIEIYRAAVRIYASKITAANQRPNPADCVNEAVLLLKKAGEIIAVSVPPGGTKK